MAAFQKGVPRPPNSGRKKGSKNIKKVLKVADFLAQNDLNPAEEILKLINAKDPKDDEKSLLGPSVRLTAWLDLLSYCQAKPKAVEDNDNDEVDPDDFDELTSADLLKLVKSDEAK